MEDSYRFYEEYGSEFPNAGKVPNIPLIRKWNNTYLNMLKASQVLHMNQFNKAFKLPDPPGKYWQGWKGDPFDKYNRRRDPNWNNASEPPV